MPGTAGPGSRARGSRNPSTARRRRSRAPRAGRGPRAIPSPAEFAAATSLAPSRPPCARQPARARDYTRATVWADGARHLLFEPGGPELRGSERDGGGGKVTVAVACHRPHHEGLVGDRPQEAIRGVRRVAVRVPIVRGACIDGVRDLVGKIELGGGRLRADAELQVHVRGAARVPARIDRSEPDGAGGVRELRAPQKRLVVHWLDVLRGDGGALVAGVDAERIALPDVHRGFCDRRAGRGGLEHAENELERHPGLALGDGFANTSLVQVERTFDLLRRQRAHWLRERALTPRRGDSAESKAAENPHRRSPVHVFLSTAPRGAGLARPRSFPGRAPQCPPPTRRDQRERAIVTCHLTTDDEERSRDVYLRSGARLQGRSRPRMVLLTLPPWGPLMASGTAP